MQKRQDETCAACRQTPIRKFIRNRLAEERHKRIKTEQDLFQQQKHEIERISAINKSLSEEIEEKKEQIKMQ